MAGGSSPSPDIVCDTRKVGENIGRDRRGVREEVGKIAGIVEIALSSPKLATNKSCSWYLVNGHEEGERERSVGVCSVGKKRRDHRDCIGRHRET